MDFPPESAAGSDLTISLMLLSAIEASGRQQDTVGG